MLIVFEVEELIYLLFLHLYLNFAVRQLGFKFLHLDLFFLIFLIFSIIISD